MSTSNQENTRWRYRCPEGHTQWRSQESGYYCTQCGKNGDGAHFTKLRDMKAEPLRY